jgi:hypothetical protein
MNIELDKFLNINGDISKQDFCKKYTSKIDLNSPIDDYYGDRMYSFQLSPIFNHMSKNHAHKFFIVVFESDTVMVCLKNLSFFADKYLRLQLYPKSLNSNTDNEKVVFDKLSEIKEFHMMWVNEDVKHLYEDNPKYRAREVDSNYYDEIKERWCEVNSDRWLRRRKIKRFLTDDKFRLKKATKENYDSIIECLDTWTESKKNDLHNKAFITFLKDNYEWCINNPDIEVLVFTYSEYAKCYDKVLGCSIIGKFGNKSYQTMLEFSLTSRTNDVNEFEDKRYKTFLQGSAQIMNYFHLKYFYENKITEYLSYAGTTSSKAKKHKVRNYSKVESITSIYMNEDKKRKNN